MIITKTPLRISLAGGGTDMPEFFHQEAGAVVSFAIDKYVYVAVNEKFDGHTRVSYSITENVKDPAELQHDLVRETLAHFGLRGLEIASVADIPGEGTGLGSSSAFLVGLCMALTRHIDQQVNVHPSVFADLAYDIERNRCGHAVGKQDHYAAAYGGMHYYQFNPDETVTAQIIQLKGDQVFFLERDLMLFWTGISRKAQPILRDQANRLAFNPAVQEAGRFMKKQALELRDAFMEGDVRNVGHVLHDGWYFKQALADGVSDPGLNMIYERALNAGATGGKLCGAGGGGFFLFHAPPENQREVERAVGLLRVPFHIVGGGSRIIYRGDE